MSRTLLIDGDILLVSTGFALEKEIEWEEDVWTLTVDLNEWKDEVRRITKSLKKDLEATDVIITLSIGETFRHQIYPNYKGNRKGRKPTGLKTMKEWLLSTPVGKFKPGIEADDTMGILATHPTLIKGEKIVVSQDKDLKTIPGKLYRGGDIIEISEAEADFYHMYQTLIGDSTDGYPGCPGVGPATAERMLKEQLKLDPYEHELRGGPRKGETEIRYAEIPAGSMWETVVSLYESKGLTEEDALTQARLARILRYTDYDFKKKEAKLWQPQ